MDHPPTPRGRRRRAQLSIRTVASAMGISPTYLCDLERRRRPWTADLLNRHIRVVDTLSAARKQKNPALASS